MDILLYITKLKVLHSFKWYIHNRIVFTELMSAYCMISNYDFTFKQENAFFGSSCGYKVMEHCRKIHKVNHVWEIV